MSKGLALIIEDNADVGLLFAIAVQEAGFEAEIVASGDRALRRLQEVEPDLVVLDLHLPRVGGADILRQIRSDERLKNLPVIVATADASAADELRDLSDLVLVKPISLSQLRDLAVRLVPSLPRTQ